MPTPTIADPTKYTTRGTARPSFLNAPCVEINVRFLCEAWRRELLEWVERLGLDRRRLGEPLVLEIGYVHFTEYVLDHNGSKCLDGTGQNVATRRISAPTDDAPDWIKNLVVRPEPN